MTSIRPNMTPRLLAVQFICACRIVSGLPFIVRESPAEARTLLPATDSL